ncbi:MAG: 5'/3'-nucleotidase SurE [Oscillospiraceae bacterium]|nr:5'/3'-nucleotidase SurE [Oscillospiraceae bacterium]
MKILVVNDDSISAPGIAALAKAAAQFGETTVVAPEFQCSALSQKLTLRQKLRVKRVEDFPVPVREAWQVDGTPVDCVKVALDYVLKEKPDLVLSGINNGYNVGFDIAYSGTVGAAFEAARQGIPAMAFSVASNAHLSAAENYLTEILRELLAERQDRGAVWNVNFPALNGKSLRGILRDRPVAQVGMYSEKYIETMDDDGCVALVCQGIPTEDSAIGAETDAAAVRQGCISISRLRAY